MVREKIKRINLTLKKNQLNSHSQPLKLVKYIEVKSTVKLSKNDLEALQQLNPQFKKGLRTPKINGDDAEFKIEFLNGKLTVDGQKIWELDNI